jgi:hypothetical protein
MISEVLLREPQAMPTLNACDVRLIFGPSVANMICEALVAEGRHTIEAAKTGSYGTTTQRLFAVHGDGAATAEGLSCDNPELRERFRTWIGQPGHREDWAFQVGQGRENLQKVFLILRSMLDEERRSGAHDSSRLRDGFSFSDLLVLLQDLGVGVTPEELSFLMDLFVDLGVAVPVITKTADGSITRVYRCGETVDAEQFASALHKSMTEWQRANPGHGGLADTAFVKICVLLKRLHPDSVPFPQSQHPHGLSLQTSPKDDVLVWAFRHRIIVRMREQPKGKDSRERDAQ